MRTSGCNLRCWFCDTPYASWDPQGKQQTVDDIVGQASESGLDHAVLTGGEPMLSAHASTLSDQLRERGMHVTIETAGTVDREVLCDLISISPKFASSAPPEAQDAKWHALHNQRRMPIETIRRLIDRAPDFQLKFVVDSPADYDELTSLVNQLRVDADDVWIMPQGSTLDTIDQAIGWLQPWCEQQGFRYCDRMQIRWYGNRCGT